ncbi:MAG: flagellar hook-associated protein FlgK [Alphaproteobacteria bacterium]
MSGVDILGNAISGLKASQAGLRHTSTNIANVNNTNFARRTIEFETRALGGIEVSQINRIANEFLTRESYSAASNARAAEVAANLHDRLQSVFGDPTSNNTISAKIDTMFADLSEMQIDPTSVVRRDGALNSIKVALDELGNIASSIQQIRGDADQGIFGRVGLTNDLLNNIHTLNLKIVSANSTGGDANALLDQRQKSLNSLAEIMDIRISRQPDGQSFVATTDGVFLVSTGFTEMRYAAGSVLTPDTVFPRITLHNIDPNTGLVSQTGQSLESHIISGELRGLLEMRDVTLPKIAEEVGELASKMADQLNAVHSNNTAVPAPNQLAGKNTGLLAADAHAFTGISNFSVTDAAGLTVISVKADFTNNQYRVNGGAAVAFAGTTIADAVAAINAGLGASGSLTFSAGVMTLGATNASHGVAMVQDATTPSVRAGRGFAHFFGLNDLVRAEAPSHYQTGLSSASAHGFTAGGTARFKLIDTLGQVKREFTLTVAGATIGDTVNQLNTGLSPFGSFSLDAQGALTLTPASGYEGSTLFVADDLTDRGGTGIGISDLFGIGPGARQNQALNMQLRPDIAANSSRLALARLNVTSPGTVALGAADDRGAIAFHALENQVTNYSAAGHLTALTSTLSDYSGQFLSNAARLASQADNLNTDRAGIREEIIAQISDVSGVNLDEELANLVIYQTSYNAAARMIKAADELFNILLDAI